MVSRKRNVIGGPLLTLLAVCIVGGAMLVQNVRLRGPFFEQIRERDRICTGKFVRRGWPFAYFERVDETVAVLDEYGRPVHEYELPPFIKEATPDLWTTPDPGNSQVHGACGNAVLAILMLASTAVVAEVRRRCGPLQFSLRSLLIATTIVGAIMALIDQSVIDWWTLLYAPIAAGFVSLPAAVGLIIGHDLLRADRRMSELRSQRQASERGLDE